MGAASWLEQPQGGISFCINFGDVICPHCPRNASLHAVLDVFAAPDLPHARQDAHGPLGRPRLLRFPGVQDRRPPRVRLQQNLLAAGPPHNRAGNALPRGEQPLHRLARRPFVAYNGGLVCGHLLIHPGAAFTKSLMCQGVLRRARPPRA
jgi:hypothetical protein